MSAGAEAVTWEGLLDFLGLLGVILDRRPDAALIGWPPGSGGAGRPILLERTEHFDEPWLVATVPLCPAGDIDPRRALELNATLVIGEVATIGDLCVVRYAAPLARLSPRDVDHVLAMLAWTPAAILAGAEGTRSESMFGHWA